MSGSTQQDFVSAYGPLAQDRSGQTGLDQSVVLGPDRPGNRLWAARPGKQCLLHFAGWPGCQFSHSPGCGERLCRTDQIEIFCRCVGPNSRGAGIRHRGRRIRERSELHGGHSVQNAATVRSLAASASAGAAAADPGFAARWGIPAPANSNGAPSAAPGPDFNSRWGIPAPSGSVPAAPSEFQTVPTREIGSGASTNLSPTDLAKLQAQVAADRAAASGAVPTPAAPMAAPATQTAPASAGTRGPTIPGPNATAAPAAAVPDATWDTAPTPIVGDPAGPLRTAPSTSGPLSYQSITNTLALGIQAPRMATSLPSPGTTRRALCVSRCRTLGADFSRAAPTAYGPALGRVTPQATMALAQSMGGLTQSPAAGSGRLIAANALQRPSALLQFLRRFSRRNSRPIPEFSRHQFQLGRRPPTRHWSRHDRRLSRLHRRPLRRLRL